MDSLKLQLNFPFHDFVFRVVEAEEGGHFFLIDQLRQRDQRFAKQIILVLLCRKAQHFQAELFSS